MAWVKASTDLAPNWDNTKQKTVEGCLVEKREHIGQFDSSVFTIEQKGGEKIAVWAKGLLEQQVKQLPVGTLVKITWTGTTKTKLGRVANTYDVEYDQESKDVSGIFTK